MGTAIKQQSAEPTHVYRGRAWLMDKLQRLLEDDDTSQPEEAIIRAAMDVLEEDAK